jgi:hypothetical protein
MSNRTHSLTSDRDLCQRCKLFPVRGEGFLYCSFCCEAMTNEAIEQFLREACA